MFRVEVKKNNIVTNASDFNTLEEAQKWVASHESKKTFGKLERWVADYNIQKQGEDLSKAVLNEIRNEPNGTVSTYFKFLPEYSIEYTDITQEVIDSKVEESALRRIEFGKRLLSKVFLINKKKKDAGLLDKNKFALMMADKDLAAIERLFNNGSLETAKELIASLNDTYFDATSKANFIALIDAYLTKEAQG